MWITADQVERKHREVFDKSRLTRLNIEHAMKQLFGHGIICRSFVSEELKHLNSEYSYNKVLSENFSELLSELARREALLARFESLGEKNSVSVENARGLLAAERGSLYSDVRWNMFLTKRKIPHLPISINEIALELCDRLFPIHLDEGLIG